jgi:hypothetical protein
MVGFAENKNHQAAELIAHAKEVSDIRAEGSPAFHLKANIRINWEGGGESVGSYTEDWVSPELWRTEIISPNFHQIELAKDNKLQVVSTLPLIADFVSPRITSAHEHLLAFHLNSNWLLPEEWKPSKIEDQTAGSLVLKCIDVNSPWEWQAALCFDRANGTIVAKSTNNKEAPYGCTYADYQKFGEKLFPRSIQCLREGKPTLLAKIVELTQATSADSLFGPMPGATELTYCSRDAVPAKVVTASGMSLSKPQPPVGLSFTVGADAKPHNVAVSRPGESDSANNAAINSLRHWSFRAATCAGKPVDTEMTVFIINIPPHGSDMAVPVPVPGPIPQ